MPGHLQMAGRRPPTCASVRPAIKINDTDHETVIGCPVARRLGRGRTQPNWKEARTQGPLHVDGVLYPEAAKEMVESDTNREDMARKTVEAAGGKLLGFYGLMGQDHHIA